MPVPGFFIELLAGMAIRLASTGNSSAVATGCLPVCIAAAHGLRALALAMRADMRLALALLLGGTAFGFLGFGPPQVAAVRGSRRRRANGTRTRPSRSGS